MLGITNPANLIPGNVKAMILMLCTTTVSRYRMIAFEKKENNPRVTRFKGRESIDRMGRTVEFIIESTNPPRRKVNSPPEILTPERTIDIK